MTKAAPRKNVKGDTSIRPDRTGTSSGRHDAAFCSSRSTGSGRSDGGSNIPWLVRGAVVRTALPMAARSAGVSRPAGAGELRVRGEAAGAFVWAMGFSFSA
jgi:hypothetical protein